MPKLQLKLPEKIRVKIMRHSSGVGYFAELPEYGVFTEADTKEGLQEMINDLIYELFDIPKEIQNKVKYVPSVKRSVPEKINSLLMMATADVFRSRVYVS